jgi:hypothetical protein
VAVRPAVAGSGATAVVGPVHVPAPVKPVVTPVRLPTAVASTPKWLGKERERVRVTLIL